MKKLWLKLILLLLLVSGINLVYYQAILLHFDPQSENPDLTQPTAFVNAAQITDYRVTDDAIYTMTRNFISFDFWNISRITPDGTVEWNWIINSNSYPNLKLLYADSGNLFTISWQNPADPGTNSHISIISRDPQGKPFTFNNYTLHEVLPANFDHEMSYRITQMQYTSGNSNYLILNIIGDDGIYHYLFMEIGNYGQIQSTTELSEFVGKPYFLRSNPSTNKILLIDNVSPQLVSLQSSYEVKPVRECVIVNYCLPSHSGVIMIDRLGSGNTLVKEYETGDQIMFFDNILPRGRPVGFYGDGLFLAKYPNEEDAPILTWIDNSDTLDYGEFDIPQDELPYSNIFSVKRSNQMLVLMASGTGSQFQDGLLIYENAYPRITIKNEPLSFVYLNIPIALITALYVLTIRERDYSKELGVDWDYPNS